MLHVETLEARCLLSRYIVTDFGSSFTARAINQSGLIVGDVNGMPKVWSHDQLFDMPMPDGYLIAIPEAINSQSIVVGYGVAADFTAHALRWSSFGVGDLDGFGSHAYALGVNDDGLIAGWSDLEPGTSHPVEWLLGGRPMDLEPNGGATADTAASINNAGQITGTFHTQAYRWTDGAFDLLDDPTGFPSQGIAINADGDVAGSWVYAVQGSRNFLSPAVWNGDSFTDIGLLPGFVDGFAASMNDGGDVVGHDGNGGPTEGFLWHDGALTQLRVSNYTITGAGAINNAGQILASGRDSTGATHSLLLTPPTALSPELATALAAIQKHSP